MSEIIGTIDMEWRDLRSHLTEEQAKDGRRCFYCGVLYLLDEFKELIPRKYVRDLNEEIERVLIIAPTPSSEE